MAYSLGVAVLYALEKLTEVKAGCILIETTLGYNLVEKFAACDQLQHDEDLQRKGRTDESSAERHLL